MVAVDTNVLIRRITNDDPRLSPKAKQLLELAKPASILLDRLIIEEVGHVLHSIYHFTKSQVGAIYQTLVSEETFFIPDREMVEHAVGLFSSEKPLSFEDCWLLALKRSGKVTNVTTFDADLQKRVQT